MGKKVRSAPTAQTVYGYSARGFENALMDSALRPDFYAELARQVAAQQMDIIARLVQLPMGSRLATTGAASGA
jgi:hypothetical protein